MALFCRDLADAPELMGSFRLWRYLKSKRRSLSHPEPGSGELGRSPAR